MLDDTEMVMTLSTSSDDAQNEVAFVPAACSMGQTVPNTESVNISHSFLVRWTN